MFEASDQVPEFIEILNRSEKVIDASRLSIGLGDPFNNDIDRLIPLKDHAFLLFPQHYLVITRHPDALPADKKVHWQKNTIGVSALFSMPNDEGVITLMDSASHSIDQMTYSKQFHENLLNETKGVSLERISPDNPSDNRSNWHSAASTENFSTPGYQNSQSILQENVVAEISLLPEIFTPDNDGIDDVVAIHLNTDLAGYFATVIIFNAQGRRIRMLADHDLIGTRDMIIWDGTDLHNLPCETGIYIIYIELFNSSGMVKSVRRTVTLAKILR